MGYNPPNRANRFVTGLVALGFGIASTLGFTGCGNGSGPSRPNNDKPVPTKSYEAFYNHIEGNPLLNQEEKSLAKRMYDFVHSDVAQAELEGKVNLDQTILDSGLNDKWGIGRRQGLSTQDQAYTSAIPLMEALSQVKYGIEQVIRNDDLSDEQIDYLGKIHKEHGNGPISSTQLLGEASSEYVAALFTALFGPNGLDDAQLLTRRELSGTVPGFIQPR